MPPIRNSQNTYSLTLPRLPYSTVTQNPNKHLAPYRKCTQTPPVQLRPAGHCFGSTLLSYYVCALIPSHALPPNITLNPVAILISFGQISSPAKDASCFLPTPAQPRGLINTAGDGPFHFTSHSLFFTSVDVCSSLSILLTVTGFHPWMFERISSHCHRFSRRSTSLSLTPHNFG